MRDTLEHTLIGNWQDLLPEVTLIGNIKISSYTKLIKFQTVFESEMVTSTCEEENFFKQYRKRSGFIIYTHIKHSHLRLK